MNFLVVLWRGLCALIAGGPVHPLVGELKSHKPLGAAGEKRIDLEAKQEERWETMFQSEIVAVEVRNVERFCIHLK